MDEFVFKEISINTSFSLAEDSMNAAPQESASFFPSSGLITLEKNVNKTSVSENTFCITFSYTGNIHCWFGNEEKHKISLIIYTLGI